MGGMLHEIVTLEPAIGAGCQRKPGGSIEQIVKMNIHITKGERWNGDSC
jgi:hypothetical protein